MAGFKMDDLAISVLNEVKLQDYEMIFDILEMVVDDCFKESTVWMAEQVVKEHKKHLKQARKKVREIRSVGENNG